MHGGTYLKNLSVLNRVAQKILSLSQDKGSPIPDSIINRYCWIMSTFTLPKHYEGEIGDEFIHYGVGKNY